MKPLRRRRYNVFLSHAHVDHDSVMRLRRWLGLAGLEVWFDAERMLAGAQFPAALAEGIADSQAMIVAVSQASIDSGWVQYECNQGQVHARNHPPFPVIPVVLDSVDVERAASVAMLLAQSAIVAPKGRLDGIESSRLLRGIHAIPDAVPPKALKSQIVASLAEAAGESRSPLVATKVPILYLTCGWRDLGNEPWLRKTVLAALDGCHVIGDAEDHPSMDPVRIEAILRGCSAQVIVVPKRGSGVLSDPEYRSLAAEVAIGERLRLPQFYVIEPGVTLAQRGAMEPLELRRTTPDTPEHTHALGLDWADRLAALVAPPSDPDYVFVATDYDDLVVQDHVVRHISQVTGLPCLIGKDFDGLMPSTKIEHAIRRAALVIANIVSGNVSETEPRVNWNSCIEAGIAVGARRPLSVIARRGTTDRWTIKDNLPFMIRNNSVMVYEDDASLIALVHRATRPFRRRILEVP